MRTLHLGLRVADLERSLTFYRALGYSVVGSVPETALGQLTMLKLPGDDFVTLELVSVPSKSMARAGDTNTLSHFVIKVESLDATLAKLGAESIDDDKDESRSHEMPDGLCTRWITDPDGNSIELVQWPPGHTDGMTATDWPHAERPDHVHAHGPAPGADRPHDRTRTRRGPFEGLNGGWRGGPRAPSKDCFLLRETQCARTVAAEGRLSLPPASESVASPRVSVASRGGCRVNSRREVASSAVGR